ncbi:hypothetical protein GTP91_13750 [Rugamonas sp. FT82W]|uniref:Uncharacterized protein n=1 Tax=Duganella vulcania TaxID=2692166 RepID=A0A845G327_9BURK|nr:hypothetical protein [Duganella vulcania]MYM88241.1 hypothetical protein [Duganella vulcania]
MAYPRWSVSSFVFLFRALRPGERCFFAVFGVLQSGQASFRLAGQAGFVAWLPQAGTACLRGYSPVNSGFPQLHDDFSMTAKN